MEGPVNETECAAVYELNFNYTGTDPLRDIKLDGLIEVDIYGSNLLISTAPSCGTSTVTPLSSSKQRITANLESCVNSNAGTPATLYTLQISIKTNEPQACINFITIMNQAIPNPSNVSVFEDVTFAGSNFDWEILTGCSIKTSNYAFPTCITNINNENTTFTGSFTDPCGNTLDGFSVCIMLQEDCVEDCENATCDFVLDQDNPTAEITTLEACEPKPVSATGCGDQSCDDNINCGVTTFDIVQSIKYKNGLPNTLNFYQKLAADMNCSGTVNALDFIAMRRLSLFIPHNFSEDCPCLGFVPNTAPSINWSDPTPNINDIPKCYSPASNPLNFTVFKRGDVDCSCDEIVGMLQDEPIELTLPNLIGLPANSIVEIPLLPNAFTYIIGFQLGIGFDPTIIEFIDYEEAYLPFDTIENYFGLTELEQGKIRMLWYEDDSLTLSNGKTLESNQPMLSLKFKVLQTPPDNSAIWLSDSILENRAWNSDDSEKLISLQDIGGTIDGKSINYGQTNSFVQELFEVSVIPNPFEHSTTLIVASNLEQEVEIILLNGEGKELFKQKEQITAGTNRIALNKLGNLPNGIYTYSIIGLNKKLFGKILKN